MYWQKNRPAMFVLHIFTNPEEKNTSRTRVKILGRISPSVRTAEPCLPSSGQWRHYNSKLQSTPCTRAARRFGFANWRTKCCCLFFKMFLKFRLWKRNPAILHQSWRRAFALQTRNKRFPWINGSLCCARHGDKAKSHARKLPSVCVFCAFKRAWSREWCQKLPC